MVVKVGVAKLGNIASGVMAELLLDERADREDMQTFMATSGTKLQPEDIDRVVNNMVAWKPDFAIVVSPNGVLPGPTGARERLLAAGIPTVFITDDVTTKKEWAEIKDGKFGYIIMKGDAMIGARREFLDPIISEWMEARTSEEVVDALLKENVPVGPVNSVDDLFKCPHLKARRMLLEIDDPVAGKRIFANTPIRMSKMKDRPPTTAPDLGAHTDEVLKGLLNYDSAAIASLHSEGIV